MSHEATVSEPVIDFSLSGVARYIQLATLFRRRIEAGQWPVGEQIPTVDELAEECAVARATVRQALGLLEDEKLIERFRAKGTFVIQKPQSALWCEVPTDLSGLLLAAEGASIEILKHEKGVMPGSVLHTGGQLAPSYQHWRRRHSREGQPYYLGDAYIDERLTRRIPKSAFKQHTTMRILRDMPDLELREIQQTITIGAADVELSRMLEIPLNAPVAHAWRTATDANGTIVFVGNGVYRGDVVRLDIKVAL
ncbi:GntR family transcriptional regulator [bacterium M00.F.Ca.ET.228.01.1.1]|uniref:Transcriptional regulator, GntR family n=1 Tax=Burkholderia sp. (strain CCGE1003) TaxID=640512 RepID=E1T9K6_BURSG|nr:GntR family transcriptional regulator [Paraburkholderia phenoliruptrix]MBW9129928.1 GntR family transcriptional regulator [Paraburkholderia ginsengiterrae]TGP39519.1 GntR family transcriptional regulator [bacterium M00.F.Ca.ET.228.01.1.1]TGR95253.1 GntR family transcriptional regulator [bacterium M00.F.Ca.ET.191.01.1.1]TGT96099.1 GntR family transcriptional regulator [bacterium M00.F.Ca.ET.155.01.1.1]MBW0448268.1 GntR family transcriptional regulator [Paraburkholderia phenoliruptrix]